MGSDGGVRIGYDNIQGRLLKKLGWLLVKVVRKKGLSVMGLRETNMK